jgi:tetratricopeptide (TPR) repeat protein
VQHLNHTLPRVAAVLSLALTAACATTKPATPSIARAPAAAKGDAAALTVVAEIALERGDCKQAAESYAQAAAAGTAPELASRAAKVALGCEHLPAAWTAASRWRALAPTDREANAVYAAVALKLYHVPEARAAIADYWRAEQTVAREHAAQRKAVDGKISPEEQASLESQVGLAELTQLLIEQSNDAPAVLAALSGAVEPDAAPPTLNLLGGVALDAYDSKRAIGYAQAVLAHEPKDVAAQRVLARAYVIQGDAAKAIATAHQEMGESGSSFELADILASLDRFEEAHQELQRLRSAGAPASEVDRRLAQLALESGDNKEAVRRFAELISGGTANDTALLYLADIASREGDAAAAISGYRRLYDSSVAVQARSRSAGLLLAKGQRTEALTLLDDYAADHPENEYELTLTKARLLADNGDADTGLSLLSAALERHPKHPGIEYERAVLLEQAGRVRESVGALEKLLIERPDDPTLLNSLGYTMADHSLELPRAEGLIRRALGSTPDSPAAIDSLGWVRYRQGDAHTAATLLGHAYSLGHDPEIAAHWGEVLWVSGDHQQARKVWAEALAREPDSKPLKATLARFVPDSHAPGH